MTTVSGRHIVAERGLASLSPSTAESTEIAGVITLSPRNIEAPMTPRIKTKAVRRPSARVASAVSESVPPSPLLSARNRISTYFSVTVTISAHTISDSTPSTTSRVTDVVVAGRNRRLAKGVKRAGADVAVDDADAAERQSARKLGGASLPAARHWPRRKLRLVHAITHRGCLVRRGTEGGPYIIASRTRIPALIARG